MSLIVPFSDFAPVIRPVQPLRAAITAAYRRPEPECVAALLPEATLPPAITALAEQTARSLIAGLRAKPRGRGVEGLIQEYSLSTQEGLALMCLAEALLRIPDAATRDALIRDKIAGGDWQAHLGHGPSLFVNAATWGLMLTGKVTAAAQNDSDGSALSGVLNRLIARGGEPLIRKAVDFAIRLMGEQFVTGQTIGEALSNSRKLEAEGFRYSYDMLGEAAMNAADAARYAHAYEQAIHAIGAAAAGRGLYDGPGISIKLSALHPRYSRSQAGRVMAELLPRLIHLAQLAKRYDIGLNIDAEEADRLEVSLDLLESLCFDPSLAGWNGVGFVVQAYGKRCPAVIDYLIDLARRSGHRLMIRLVKGAYWDSEIKRAQVDGLADFPVYTRKLHTDLSYVACARRLLAAPDAIFPQFATHNAQTLATIYALAGPDFQIGAYEFQCLHGMGETLYQDVVGPLNRPCRIYAPVGTHETLLAYLVRRLLENGANSSFVHRIADPAIPLDALVADPVALVQATMPLGAPHDRIAAPSALFAPERQNSAGLDLSDETGLAALSAALRASADHSWQARPLLGDGEGAGNAEPVCNPADHRDLVGTRIHATPAQVDHAFALTCAAAGDWAATPPKERAACLLRAADRLQAQMAPLIGLLIREAGKSTANAIAEIREAIDFLRYYATQAAERYTATNHQALGPVVCISPWNFPLAIFTGQIAAALAAGNVVLAKPAPATPLIAAETVRLLRQAGIPSAALQLLPGLGDIGAQMVGHAATSAVLFTGSTEIARQIQRQLADRVAPDGRPIPLIAETGGQNAMIVDSSALAEQVVSDVIASAFDSAGQRCSALRVLCVQEEIAESLLAMLTGAMAELRIGHPDQLAVDIGPVITADAQQRIIQHIDRLRAQGHRVTSLPLPDITRHGTFVAPTLIEIASISDIPREIFGPVLHVLRYRRDQLDSVIAAINATGYGLTFGLHTRIDATIDRVSRQIQAGNLYINRNMIGAVVGVQPFGGRGLSGTGPKAGGPLYLDRLLRQRPPQSDDPIERELPGPVGETNRYRRHPRGRILLLPATLPGLQMQLQAVFATGNSALIDAPASLIAQLPALPPEQAQRLHISEQWDSAGPLAGALIEGDAARVIAAQQRIAALPGPILLTQAIADPSRDSYGLEWLMDEQTISTNTAAAGGNASLVAIA